MTDQARLNRIDQLIGKAIDNNHKKFEDIFLYVGKNFSGDRPHKFVDVVYRRLLKMSRSGDIFYDKSLKEWMIRCYS